MPSHHNVREKLDKLNDEVLHLIADWVALSREAQEEDAEIVGPEYQADVVDSWFAAADEQDWNPAAAGRAAKAILDLAKPLE